ncbi:Protein of unknown function [Pyronema omphalodes CBS 100304]|uniref:Uncharacterized protein n=1 Tax=Pyronema omphalodes (strain CBS 100304) TaxID=1076935 RepID=U4LVZ0_PYROM|nr:Protein of unknown function [Pyronema omphalodes CBS 100304]
MTTKSCLISKDSVYARDIIGSIRKTPPSIEMMRRATMSVVELHNVVLQHVSCLEKHSMLLA